MPTITYLQPDGSSDTLEADDGTSVMRAAVSNDIRGIVGECGGQAMCATCHVYVRGNSGLPPIDDDEDEMLDCTSAPRQANSRLGCQLRAGEHFTSLTVSVPERQ